MKAGREPRLLRGLAMAQHLRHSASRAGPTCVLLAQLQQAESARDVAGVEPPLRRSQERLRQAPDPLAGSQLLQALLLVAIKPAV